MLKDQANWAACDAYAYFDDLTAEGLAWELLRRNFDYQCEYHELVGSGVTGAPLERFLQFWGLQVAVDPERSALDGPIFFRPELNCGAIALAVWPGRPADQKATQTARALGLERFETSGTFGYGAVQFQLHKPNPIPKDSALAVLIPLDASLGSRLRALYQFWHALRHGPSAKPPGLQSKARELGLLMRAVDARSCGVSQKLIAYHLFGETQGRPIAWPNSYLRYNLHRLLKKADRLIGGDYRKWLRS